METSRRRFLLKVVSSLPHWVENARDMLKNLREVISKIAAAAEQHGEGSRMIADSAASLSEGAQNQAGEHRADWFLNG